MLTMCGKMLVALTLLGTLAGCAGLGTESMAVAPTAAPVYDVMGDM